MKIISSVQLSKGYEHWRGMFLANEDFRQEHGINVLAYGHEEGNKDKVWVCMEVDSMEKMMSTVDKPCLLYTSPSPRDRSLSRMPSSA